MRFPYMLKLFILVFFVSGCVSSGPTIESEAYVKSQLSASLAALEEAPMCCQALSEASMTQLEYPDIVSFEISREDQAFEFSNRNSQKLYNPNIFNINFKPCHHTIRIRILFN